MLSDFIEASQGEILNRLRALVVGRDRPGATGGTTAADAGDGGVVLFLSQLVDRLRDDSPSSGDLAISAAAHGHSMLRDGQTIAQVVQSYGDVCQVVTTLAIERSLPVTTEEFRILNRCLDAATAEAVSEYERRRDRDASEVGTERLGFLAHELRNKLHSAMMAFDSLKGGKVGIEGSTGGVLGRSLAGIRTLIDRALMEVRLESGLVTKERVALRTFMEEVEVEGRFEAKQKAIALVVASSDGGVEIEIDRHILASAVGNLIQNACKFTAAGGRVTVRTRAEGGRVSIDIEDECGGLPPGATESLFRPFEQRGRDRTGLGLGLAISRRGVEASGGELRVRDLPRQGCVFTISLPVAPGRRA